MRLGICALALLLAGCTPSVVSPPAVPEPSYPGVPVISDQGLTNVYGMWLDLDSAYWSQAHIASTQTELWIDYSADRQACQGQCPTLLIATAKSQYYRLSTLRDGSVFKTETECAQGASAFDTAEEKEPNLTVGGRRVQYFVNPRCPHFQQPSDGSLQRYTWFLPDEGLMIQLLPATNKSILGHVRDVLQRAQW